VVGRVVAQAGIGAGDQDDEVGWVGHGFYLEDGFNSSVGGQHNL